MITGYRKFTLATLLIILFALVITPSASGAVVWQTIFDRYDTGNLKFYTPDRIQYYAGYQYNSQGGSWGRHIYGSTDPYWQDQNTMNDMYSVYVSSNYQQIPAISFDESQSGNLHATGWYYAPNYSNPTFWREDDDSNGRLEAAKLRFVPLGSPQNANVEVEFWDASWNGSNVPTSGKLNVSAYWVAAIGGWRIDSQHLGAFCFNGSDQFSNC